MSPYHMHTLLGKPACVDLKFSHFEYGVFLDCDCGNTSLMLAVWHCRICGFVYPPPTPISCGDEDEIVPPLRWPGKQSLAC